MITASQYLDHFGLNLNSTGMNVIGSYVLYQEMYNKTNQDLSFNVIDIEGSVLLGCTDTHTGFDVNK